MNLNDVQVRRATSDDFNDVMNVERLAFGEDGEAVLVEDLLADQTAEPYVSLLACYQGEAIGHILFTKASLEGSNPSPSVYILAPLAVKPEYQKQGLGGLLIREGHRILKEMGVEMVLCWGIKSIIPAMVLRGMQKQPVIRLLIRLKISMLIVGCINPLLRKQEVFLKER